MKTKLPYLALAFSLLAACGDETGTPSNASCGPNDLRRLDKHIKGPHTLCGSVRVTNGWAALDDVVLTIRPGSVLRFESNAGLIPAHQLTLLAQGTEDQPIVFEGVDGGSWYGIDFRGGTGSKLEHVTIQDVTDGTALSGPTALIKDLTINNSKIGLNFDSFEVGSKNLNMSNSVGPIAYLNTPEAVTNFPAGGELDAENAYIDLDFDDVGTAITFPKTSAPFRTSGLGNTKPATVIFEAGATLEFTAQGLSLGGEDKAVVLKAMGSAEDPVTFRTAEDYLGVWIDANSTVELDFTTFDKILPISYAPVTVRNVQMTNCTDCGAIHGHFVDGSTALISAGGIGLSPDALVTLPAGSVIGGVIEVAGQELSKSGVIRKNAEEIRFLQDVYNTTDITLRIEDETVLDFGVTNALFLGVDFPIDFQANNVTFTGQGWNGLRLRNAVAGSFIRNSTIEKSSNWALVVDGSIEVTGNTISGRDFCIDTYETTPPDYAATNTLNCERGAVNLLPPN